MIGGEDEGACEARAGIVVVGTAERCVWVLTIGAGEVNKSSKLRSRGVTGTKERKTDNQRVELKIKEEI